MSGLPFLTDTHRVELGGGARHAVLCDRDEVVNVVLWDGLSPYRHPPITRADGSISAARLLRQDTLAIGDRAIPVPDATMTDTTR